MRKNKFLLTLSSLAMMFAVLPLFSCGNKSNSISPKDSKLVFTEYVQSDNNFAIEIYNNSDEEVDLKNYSLVEYYKAKETKITYTLKLKGKLASHETYVVVSGDSTEECKSKADYVEEKTDTSGFKSLGTQVFALQLKGTTVDSLGNLGYRTDWGRDVTLMRRPDKFNCNGTNYNYKEWLEYPQDTIDYLGVSDPTVTTQELFEGPRFDPEYLNIPYANPENPNVGFGGAVRAAARLSEKEKQNENAMYTIDGDTCDLYYYDWDATECVTNSNYASNNVPTGYTSWSRVRYFNVDTMESYPGNVQEFGLAAKYFMNNLIKHGDKTNSLYVQSIKGNGVTGNFGRLLAFVYTDTYLANFLLVRYGLSQAGNIGQLYSDGMTYKGLPFSTYFHQAEYYAEENHLGLYGEKDPNWDYEKNTDKGTKIDPYKFFDSIA